MLDIKPKYICSRCGRGCFRIYHTVWDEDLCFQCLELRYDWIMHFEKLKLYEVVASFTIYARDKADAQKKTNKMAGSDDARTLREIDTWIIRDAEKEVDKEYKQYSPPEAIIKQMNKAEEARRKKKQEA